MKKRSAEKEKHYLSDLDRWALSIIQDIVKKYQWLHQSRLDRDELVNAAFIFYRDRLKKLKRISKPLLIYITKAYIHTYVSVNDIVMKIPGGTLTKKGGEKKVREILAKLRTDELLYEDKTMTKDLKIDYETLISALPYSEKIVMISMLLGHHRKFTTELLKGLGVKNSREVMERAVSRIIRDFTEQGYL